MLISIVGLRELIHLVDFRSFLQGRKNASSCWFLAQDVSSQMGFTLEGKNLLQRGANFFLLKADHIPEARQHNFDIVVSLDLYPFSVRLV